MNIIWAPLLFPHFHDSEFQLCSLRSGADTHSTARVLVTIVQLSFEAGDWPGMIVDYYCVETIRV